MLISGFIIGVLIILYGLFLLAQIFPESIFWAIIVGGGMIFLGLFIMFNKNEDKIEKIKSRGGKK